MDYFYLDMEYDVQLNQVDEDHEEVNELINYQFHLTKKTNKFGFFIRK
jgi:hemerythrin